MKNSLFSAVIIFIIFSVSLSDTAFAQHHFPWENTNIVNDSGAAQKEIVYTSEKPSETALKINTHALRDFKTRFAGTENEKWYNSSKGFVVYFKKNDFMNRV